MFSQYGYHHRRLCNNAFIFCWTFIAYVMTDQQKKYVLMKHDLIDVNKNAACHALNMFCFTQSPLFYFSQTTPWHADITKYNPYIWGAFLKSVLMWDMHCSIISFLHRIYNQVAKSCLGAFMERSCLFMMCLFRMSAKNNHELPPNGVFEQQ